VCFKLCFYFYRTSVIIVGVGSYIRNDYLLSIAENPNRILRLRDLRELYPGKAAFKILADLLKNPDYGKVEKPHV